jgi:hypothetical protein
LRPFARTDLSESDRVKSGGIITTKLVLLAALMWSVAGEMGRLLNKELNLEALFASRNEQSLEFNTRMNWMMSFLKMEGHEVDRMDLTCKIPESNV